MARLIREDACGQCFSPSCRPERNRQPLPLAHVTSWWGPAGECTVTIAEPGAAPDLFAEYYDGAVESYPKFGVSDAIDADAGRCADDTPRCSGR